MSDGNSLLTITAAARGGSGILRRSAHSTALVLCSMSALVHIQIVRTVAATPSDTEVQKLMIDALANTNPEPRLVYDGVANNPLFPANYDWSEQKAARRALVAIAKAESDELWEELFRHFDDKRYSLTMAQDSDYAQNYSVGDICEMVAYHRLWAAFEDDLPTREDGRPVKPDLRIWSRLSAWRAERQGKALYELQIEVCELAIKGLGQEPDVAKRAVQESQQKIQATIRRLRETKRAIFRRLPLDGYSLYSPERAERIRKELEPAGDCGK